MSEDLRCRECGALVSAEADWCGQCFSRLAPAAEDLPEQPAQVPDDDARREVSSNVVPLERKGKAPTWPCPSCGNDNPLELDSCAVCGTPFAKLFREDEATFPTVAPGRALLWSLAVPGLGHWMLGRRLEGIARMVLFAWTAGTTLVLLLSRSGKGLGPVASLVLLFLGSAVILYLLSALDAYRMASGNPAVVSARMLLWGSAALVLLSTIVATVVAFPAMRGR